MNGRLRAILSTDADVLQLRLSFQWLLATNGPSGTVNRSNSILRFISLFFAVFIRPTFACRPNSPLLSRLLQGPHQTRHTETRNYQHGHLVDYRTHQPHSQIANSSGLLSEDGQSREFYSSMRSLRLCCRSIWMEQARAGASRVVRPDLFSSPQI